MKKVKSFLITSIAFILGVGLFYNSNAGTGQKAGETYIYQGINENGEVNDYAYNTCDPCGPIGTALWCNCVESIGKYPANTLMP